MHALEINQLCKTYKSGLNALNNISLTVEQGEFFGLLGPNGAGKTTTIGIICSLVNKSSGTVKVFDIDIDKNFPLAKMHIGIVPQEFNFNIFEKVNNILLTQAGFYGVPRKLAKARVQELLERLSLWDKRKESARTLSGGMKRRLMIARALVHQPKLLILDEPSAGVDIELRRQMWEYLKDINRQGTTIILTTHYLEEAEQLCPRLAIIDKGKIVEQGATKKLLAGVCQETFVLDLAQPLQDLPQVADLTLRKLDENTLELDVDKAHHLDEYFHLMAEHGILVSSMRNKTNRLEELFVKLVSKHENE